MVSMLPGLSPNPRRRRIRDQSRLERLAPIRFVRAAGGITINMIAVSRDCTHQRGLSETHQYPCPRNARRSLAVAPSPLRRAPLRARKGEHVLAAI